MGRIMKRLLQILIVVVIGFVGIILWNTFTFQATQPAAAQFTPPPHLDSMAAFQRFSRALQIPTISYEPPATINSTVYEQFVTYLQTAFPQTFAKLHWQRMGQFSLLLEWSGQNPRLAPVVLMAHYDVVPVDSSSLQQWEFDPFSGQITERYILGRGALDDKVNVMAILEAVELLATTDFQPQRTVYIAIGHDEEIGGQHGAKLIAQRIKSRHKAFHLVIDEGGAVVKDAIKGITPPVALIGIAEKGYVTLELSTRGKGGHSSMPPPHTAIGRLAAGITRLENHPFPARFTAPTKGFLEAAAPYMPFSARVFIANLGLLGPVLKRVLLQSPTTAAMIRTTTAVTVIRGGVKDNVIPTGATALVNFRILPGETSRDVLAYVKQTVDDTAITVRKMNGAIEPSAVSRTDVAVFQQLRSIIRALYPNTLTAPYLVMGATDSRYYAEASDRVYRFSPVYIHKSDLERIHGINERVRKSSFIKAIQFYYQLIREVQPT